MYELGGPFPGVSVPPGTNILISGPPMMGKQDLAFQALGHGHNQGDAAVIVTTKDNADRVRDSFEEHASGDAPLGIIDCVTKQQGMDAVDDQPLVRYASSPVDLTGIGIELSELLQEFYQERGITNNRVLLYSLSTLLMYSNLQTVFRFLHVFTGRLQSADGLGLFIIDPTAHEDQTMSTLQQLFDGRIEVRESDEGRETRITGVAQAAGEWTEL
jgi:KaiC/GvpD/RAD55 family RecA-like ATPase